MDQNVLDSFIHLGNPSFSLFIFYFEDDSAIFLKKC